MKYLQAVHQMYFSGDSVRRPGWPAGKQWSLKAPFIVEVVSGRTTRRVTPSPEEIKALDWECIPRRN